MTGRPFSLIPFPDTHVPDIVIAGEILRQKNALTIHYRLPQKIEDIFLPAPSFNPTRKDDLWKTTCFEFFLAIEDLPEYWEINLSPSGDWNLYHMDTYRRIGFREETFIQHLPFRVQKDIDVFALNAAMDLDPIVRAGQVLEVGIAAIIQSRNGTETYWALNHPGPQPDFHSRGSFVIRV
jgi:hypothetical protein